MSTYQKVNISIAAVLSFVLLLLFWGTSTGVVRCPFDSQLGLPCQSCGISRDIFQYLQLNFDTPINPHSLKVFFFLVGQTTLRAFLAIFKQSNISSIIKLDIGLSISWFIWVFASLVFS